MSNDWVSMVREFQLKFGQPVAERPGLLPFSRAKFRHGLIYEESRETWDAIRFAGLTENSDAEDIAEIADGLADLIYVCIGTALEYGIPLDAVMREVHRSNMAKVGGAMREDGKVLKPEGWQPPDTVGIIRKEMEK